MTPPSKPACTEERVAPVADAIVATGLVVGAIVLTAGLREGDEPAPPKLLLIPAAWGALGLLTGWSAYNGFRDACRCRAQRRADANVRTTSRR